MFNACQLLEQVMGARPENTRNTGGQAQGMGSALQGDQWQSRALSSRPDMRGADLSKRGAPPRAPDPSASRVQAGMRFLAQPEQDRTRGKHGQRHEPEGRLGRAR